MKYVKTFEQFINEGKKVPDILKELKDSFIRKSVKVTGVNESDSESLSKCFIFKEGKMYVNLDNSPLEDGVCDSLKEMFESLLQTDPYNMCVKYNFNQNHGWCVWESQDMNESAINEAYGKGNPIDNVLSFVNKYNYANGKATAGHNDFIFKDSNPVEIEVQWAGFNDEDSMSEVMKFINDVNDVFSSLGRKFHFFEPDSDKKYTVKDFIKYNKDFIDELVNETR